MKNIIEKIEFSQNSLNQYLIESENQKVGEETYVIIEISLNDIQSDNYLSKCLHETYADRQIIVRGDMGIRYYMYILNVRELKNCYAEYPFRKNWPNRNCWIAPDEIQEGDNKTIQEYIKKHSDKIEWNDILSKDNKVQINVMR